MPNGNGKKRGDKPAKPYEDFPLFPHATGRWAKKIRGKLHYFGPWENPQAALDKYLDQKDDLYAGRTPRAGGDGLTVADLCNRFLTAKLKMRDAGDITHRTFADYKTTTDNIVAAFGKRRLVEDLAADDFEHLRAELAKTRGPVALGNEVNRTRIVFRYAYESGLIEKPVRFGPSFVRPSRRTVRTAQQASGLRLFEPKELQAVLDAAEPQMKAMTLLGVNCAFGNADVAALPQSALDLKRGFIDFPRPKTGIPRRAPLWRETIKAVRAALEVRPQPKADEDADLVFVTKYGHRWVRPTSTGKPINCVSHEFRKLLKEVKVYRKGLNFYALRHTFETIGGETADQPAVDRIMGHERDDMPTRYRQRIGDDRLRAVTNHVRRWLWPPKRKKKVSKKAVVKAT